MKKYIIFDFDQTIVDSSDLADARQAQKWDSVLENLNSFRAYEGMIELIQQLREKGGKVGIYTSSPSHICQAVCDKLGIIVDVIVGYQDIVVGGRAKAKPDAHGMRYTLAKLINPKNNVAPGNLAQFVFNHKSYAIAIGDRWSDTVAGTQAGIETIAALWGLSDADDVDELITSRPTAIAGNPSELKDILTNSHKFLLARTLAKEKYTKNLWKKVDAHDRGNLREGAQYYFARKRWRGGWNLSHGNNLVFTLKSSISKHQYAETYKNKACLFLAEELSVLLPENALVSFIKSAKMPGAEDYDDRWERTAHALKNLRSDIRVIDSILPISSRTAVHTTEDYSARDPKKNLENLQWQGGLPSDAEEIWLVDDVITSGGQFEAYLRLFEEHAPTVRVKGAFWTQHMGEKAVSKISQLLHLDLAQLEIK